MDLNRILKELTWKFFLRYMQLTRVKYVLHAVIMINPNYYSNPFHIEFSSDRRVALKYGNDNHLPSTVTVATYTRNLKLECALRTKSLVFDDAVGCSINRDI